MQGPNCYVRTQEWAEVPTLQYDTRLESSEQGPVPTSSQHPPLVMKRLLLALQSRHERNEQFAWRGDRRRGKQLYFPADLGGQTEDFSFWVPLLCLGELGSERRGSVGTSLMSLCTLALGIGYRETYVSRQNCFLKEEKVWALYWGRQEIQSRLPCHLIQFFLPLLGSSL